MLDVRGVAELLGTTADMIRSRVSRGLLPYRRWGGRIIFVRSEVEAFLRQLPGCSFDEALRNQAERQGQ